MPNGVGHLLIEGWHWEPGILAGLIGLTGAYLYAIGPLRRRHGWAAGIEGSRVMAFLAGMLVVFIALISPLDTLSDHYLLSAHMVQHLLLTLAMPPLLLLGTPEWLLRPLLRFPLVKRAARLLTSPWVAYALFNATFSLWHVPSLYDWTLDSEPVHIVEHLTFMATAVLAWWPILSPLPELPRLPHPGQMVYLFFQSIPPTLIGAIITFSPTVLYTPYAAASRLWGVTALADQQIGGLIMWIPGSLVFLLALTIVFFQWLNPDEEQITNVKYQTSNDKFRI